MAAELSRLRLLSVILPAAFATSVIVITAVFAGHIPLPLLLSIGVLTVTAAAALFSAVVFHVIEESESGLIERNQQLAAVQDAAMSIAGEFDLATLLERFVERSRSLTSARYGAMTVLAPDGQIAEFITSGMSTEQKAQLPHLPTGRGLLGAIINQQRALRLEDLTKDPGFSGFPPNHPNMKSLLGVPVISRSRTIGNLYLTDKEGARFFTEADEEMVRTFAAYAAVAVETSRLLDDLRLLAVLRDRERIGMDLHDGVIQSIYAVSLGLETAADDLPTQPEGVRNAVDAAIEQLNEIIRDVRNYIFELRPAKLSYDLSESIARMVQEFQANSQLRVETDIAPALPPLEEAQRAALFHITQEALVNARKHARAATIHVSLRPQLNVVRLSVSDDGRGFDVSASPPDGHHGIRNMAARAEAAGGVFRVHSVAAEGTLIEVELPILSAEGAMP